MPNQNKQAFIYQSITKAKLVWKDSEKKKKKKRAGMERNSQK